MDSVATEKTNGAGDHSWPVERSGEDIAMGSGADLEIMMTSADDSEEEPTRAVYVPAESADSHPRPVAKMSSKDCANAATEAPVNVALTTLLSSFKSHLKQHILSASRDVHDLTQSSTGATSEDLRRIVDDILLPHIEEMQQCLDKMEAIKQGLE